MQIAQRRIVPPNKRHAVLRIETYYRSFVAFCSFDFIMLMPPFDAIQLCAIMLDISARVCAVATLGSGPSCQLVHLLFFRLQSLSHRLHLAHQLGPLLILAIVTLLQRRIDATIRC